MCIYACLICFVLRRLPLNPTDTSDNTHKFKPYEEVKADLEAAGITKDKDILAYYGTSREGSLLRFYLRYVAGYPKVRLYEGAWKEYVWLKDKSLPAETEPPQKK